MRSDGEWIGGLRAGAPDVSADLRDYLVRSVAKGFPTLGSAEREDLVHEAFARVLESLDRFEGRSRFTTWTAAIAVNTVLAHLRRAKHEPVPTAFAIERADAALSAPARVHRAELDAALRDAIATALTERQRNALLAELGGLPLAVVAERMGTTRGALYKLLHDARKKLKAALIARGIDTAVAP